MNRLELTLTRARQQKLAALFLAAAAALQAQTTTTSTAPAAKDEPLQLEAVSVTGSNIKRLDQEKTLPVTVFTSEQVEARDSATPMDLLIGIPQITNIPQNETSVNAVAARGGNANVALRGLTSANTLVLLNGRRMPFYPFNTSSVNVESLPTGVAVGQIEVLRDGASAIYGSDAVAGVVNYVTDKRPNGGLATFRAGVTEHGGGSDFEGTVSFGTVFAGGKGTWVTDATAYYRNKIYLYQRSESRYSDRTGIAKPPFNVFGSSYDGSTSIGVYPSFYVGTSTTSTTATTYFYPTDGVRGDTPSLTNTAIPHSLYANYNTWTVGQPQSARFNVYNHVEYQLLPSIKVFGEVIAYKDDDVTGRQPITLNVSNRRVQLSADNPFNPYGSHFYNVGGAPNADGSARLVGTPQPLTVVGVLMQDGGNEKITSDETMYRLLGGLNGNIGTTSWTWETAATLGGVRGTDFSVNGVRASELQAAAQRTDATAWNPFGYTFKVVNGAVVADTPYNNPKSVRDTYTQSLNRFGHSKIAVGDARFGGNVFDLWAGPIAASVGVEWRYEYKEDHKDPYAAVNPPDSGLDPNDNDFLVTSPKKNYAASRTIASAYAETVVPILEAKNAIPFAQSIEFNGSVRSERYSDFGNTTKPKFGGTWKPFTWLLFRASLNKGFRAPDLADLYQPTSFSNATPPGSRDPVRNNYFTSAGLPADAQIITRGYSIANPYLQPEQSTGRSGGVVVDVPQIKGLSFSIDYWEITQKNLIVSQSTTTNLDNQLLLAYTQQQLAAGKSITSINVGSHVTPDGTNTYVGDPFVLRNPVTPADIALFQQTYAVLPQNQWIAPLGSIVGSISQQVNSTGNNFTNGFDYSISYSIPRTRVGAFRISTDWAQFLNKFTRLKPNYGKNDDLIQMIVPRWKGSATVQWRLGGWDSTVNATYSTDVRTGASTTAALYTAAGSPAYIKTFNIVSTAGVPVLNYYERGGDQLQLNYGLSYRFGALSNVWVRRTTFRLGIDNFLDQKPSLQGASGTGYSGSTGSSLWVGRAFTFAAKREF